MYHYSSEYASPWRNRLARFTANEKVGGSTPPGDAMCDPLRDHPPLENSTMEVPGLLFVAVVVAYR